MRRNNILKFNPNIIKINRASSGSFKIESTEDLLLKLNSFYDILNKNVRVEFESGATQVNIMIKFRDGWVSKTGDFISVLENIGFSYITSSIISMNKNEYELTKTISLKRESFNKATHFISKSITLLETIINEGITEVKKPTNLKSKKPETIMQNEIDRKIFSHFNSIIKKCDDFKNKNGLILDWFGKFENFGGTHKVVAPQKNLDTDYIITLQSNSNPNNEYQYINDEKTMLIMNGNELVKNYEELKVLDWDLSTTLIKFKDEYFPLDVNFESNKKDLNKNVKPIGLIDTSVSDEFLKHEGVEMYDLGHDITDDEQWLNNVDFSIVGNEKVFHGEIVASLYMYGDELNNFDDECGKLPITIYPALTKNVKYYALEKRIRHIVENTDHNIYLITSSGKIENDLKISISDYGKFLDKLSNEIDRDVKFIVSGTNNDEEGIDFGSLEAEDFEKAPFILGPADSLNSFSVNAVGNFDNQIPAQYSRKGMSNYITLKPDLSYLGGDESPSTQIFSQCRNMKYLLSTGGTSFSAPLLARLYSTLYYAYGFNFNEIEALLINDAIRNQILLMGRHPNVLHGNGIPSQKISEILSTESDTLTIVCTKVTDSWIQQELEFPLLWGTENKNKNRIFITVVSDSVIDHDYGVEAVRNSVNTNIIDEKKFNKKKTDINFEGDTIKIGIALKEKDLIKYKGKWKKRHSLLVEPQETNSRTREIELTDESVKLEFRRETRTTKGDEKINFSFAISIINTEGVIDAEEYENRLISREWEKIEIREKEKEREKEV